MATVYIGGASIDERGKASGGQAGNQSGRELRKQPYYDHDKRWYVFRARNPGVREDIAVAAIDQEGVDRVTAAQAADELLSLKGVKASFVVFPSGENVQMSARSLGEVNVQVILEALGGGGNSTTAGGRVENTDVETVKSRLLEAIDAYFEK